MDFVLINASTTTAAEYGGELTAATLEKIAVALERQLNVDFSTAGWGGSFRVRVGSSSSDVLPGEIPAIIVDSMPPADADAAAFHTIDGSARPSIVIARDAANSLTRGPSSVSVSASHELLEAAADVGCNEWCVRADGKLKAREVCDQVEDTSYDIEVEGEPVAVSNFNLPSAFVPGAPAPFDFLHVLASPDACTPGGYEVVMTPGEASQEGAKLAESRDPRVVASPEAGQSASITLEGVGADPGIPLERPRVTLEGTVRPERLAKKRHPSSRTYRRGVRL